MKSYTAPIKEVRKVDDYAVEIETNAPFPILPDTLTSWYMHEQEVVRGEQGRAPGRPAQGHRERGLASRPTAPARTGCASASRDVRTVFVRNCNYWGKVDGNVDEVIFTPIGNDATRVAALLSGEIDVMEPVPVQDVERIKAGANLKVLQGPELRTIFLGMDQKRDELLFSSVKGKNPFKDKRVRQAFYQAIDIEAIKRA